MVKTLSRVNREMQLDNWTAVNLDFLTLSRIHRDFADENDNFEECQTGETVGTMKAFLERECRKTIKGGFAIQHDALSGLVFLFQRSSEAVRFKLMWGGQ